MRPTLAPDLYLITNDINLRRQPSLRSQLNQIRMWVRQGRTDAWIAHKLDVSVDDLARFKRDHDLEGDGDGDGARARPADPLSVPPPEPRAEEPEEPEEPEDEEEEEEPDREARRRSRSRGRRRGGRGARPSTEEEAEEAEEEEQPVSASGSSEGEEELEGGVPRKRRRRGRRGGRRHRARRDAYEATFDHGQEGYGLWLDPAVADNPVYSEHWAGHRAVTVTVEPESITIRRAVAGRGEPAEDEDAAE